MNLCASISVYAGGPGSGPTAPCPQCGPSGGSADEAHEKWSTTQDRYDLQRLRKAYQAQHPESKEKHFLQWMEEKSGFKERWQNKGGLLSRMNKLDVGYRRWQRAHKEGEKAVGKEFKKLRKAYGREFPEHKPGDFAQWLLGRKKQ